MKIKRNK